MPVPLPGVSAPEVRLVLASASPRRAELLRAAGFAFDVQPVNLDEAVRPGETPDAYVQRLASEKSLAAHVARVSSRTGDIGGTGDTGDNVVTLGADTAVVIDGVILGKPVDETEAEAMLRRLSGRTHEVLTGISLRRGDREVARVERTRVTFTTLSNQDIQWHVLSQEGMDKAGGYAIQGLASRFIPRIDGSYSNVVGLPVTAVAAALAVLANPLNGSGDADGNP